MPQTMESMVGSPTADIVGYNDHALFEIPCSHDRLSPTRPNSTSMYENVIVWSLAAKKSLGSSLFALVFRFSGSIGLRIQAAELLGRSGHAIAQSRGKTGPRPDAPYAQR